MSIRIAYLSVISSFSHSSPVYGHLRSISEQNCEEKTIWLHIEVSINENYDLPIQKLIEFKPDLILSTGYLFNVEMLTKIFARVNVLLPKTTIALGGPEFLGNNEEFLIKHKFISVVFRGDESHLPKFLNFLYAKNQWSSIQGICCLDNGKYIDSGSAKFEQPLDSLPSLYEKGYFSKDKPFIHFETSRGCPSHCLFCSSANSKPVYYSLERVEADLSIIAASGIKEIRILDRTFNVPEERAISLIELFVSKFSDLKFHLEIDPSRLSEKLLETFGKAPNDMFHLEAGIQSFSPDVIMAVNRRSDTHKVCSNLLQLCSMQNLKVHADLIAGLPKQNFNDVIDDLYTLAELKPDEIQLELLKILQGSPLRSKDIFDASYSPIPPYEILQTPDFSYTELVMAKVISKIIDACYNEEKLKKLFRFALKTNNKFLTDFSRHYMNVFSRKEKPSLETRLNLFYDFAGISGNQLLHEMTIFTSLMLGIIPRRENRIRLLKNKEMESLKRQTIWKASKDLHTEYAVECVFNSNPLEFFLNNKIAGYQQEPTTYIFCYPTLSFSKTISHIERVV